MGSKAQRQKGWLLPDDISDIVDADLVMFCGLVPNEQHAIAALNGAIQELTYWWNWEKTDGREAADVAIYMRQVLECFVIDCCAKMQACIGDTIRPLLDSQARELLEKLNDLYDGNPGSVAPDLVYDGSGDDAQRDILLCYMCRVFVDLILDAEIDRRNKQIEQAYWIANLLGNLGAIVAPIIPAGGAILALGAAIGTAVAAGAVALYALSELALNDTGARERVACCMYANLAGATPSFSAFQASMSGCGFNILDNAEYIRQTLEPLMTDLNVYLGFLATSEELWPFVESGLLDTCPCDEYDWIYISDFETDGDGWGSAEDFEPTCLYRDAVYNPAGYWEWHVGLRPAFMLIHPMLAGTEIIEITIDWELSGFNGGEGMVYNNYDPSGCTPNGAVSAYQDWQQNGRNIRTLAINYTFSASDQYLGWNVDVDPSDANIKLYQIVIKGKGPNPFAAAPPIEP